MKINPLIPIQIKYSQCLIQDTKEGHPCQSCPEGIIDVYPSIGYLRAAPKIKLHTDSSCWPGGLSPTPGMARLDNRRHDRSRNAQSVCKPRDTHAGLRPTLESEHGRCLAQYHPRCTTICPMPGGSSGQQIKALTVSWPFRVIKH